MRTTNPLLVISLLLASPVTSADEKPLPNAERRLVAGGQGFFPVACKLRDGRIAVVLRGGASHVGIKGRLDIVFSDDGGKTWETNWVATDTRIGD